MAIQVYQTRIINGHSLLNPTEKTKQSPDILDPQARALWDVTRRNAASYYKDAWDLADMAAWRAVKMRYPQYNDSGSKTTVPEGPMTLPDPKQMIILGRVLEYVVLEDPPRLDVYRFRNDQQAPQLMWSPSQRMLLVLPGDRISEERNPNLGRYTKTANLYREWSWGQDPRGYVVHDVKAFNLKPLGMADSIVYRSGKGTSVRDDPAGIQEYIHQFGDGVVAYQGPRVNEPRAIVFRGGKLDVQEPGIIN